VAWGGDLALDRAVASGFRHRPCLARRAGGRVSAELAGMVSGAASPPHARKPANPKGAVPEHPQAKTNGRTRKDWKPATLDAHGVTRDGTAYVLPNGERYDPTREPKMIAPAG